MRDRDIPVWDPPCFRSAGELRPLPPSCAGTCMPGRTVEDGNAAEREVGQAVPAGTECRTGTIPDHLLTLQSGKICTLLQGCGECVRINVASDAGLRAMPGLATFRSGFGRGEAAKSTEAGSIR
jgi:hypothetical protein